MKNVQEILQTLRNQYLSRGHEAYHGEPVSQLEHAVQSAEWAQETRPDDEEFIIAAFLHDYGHLCDDDGMEGYGVWSHETVGADALRQMGFSDKIAQLVAGHVEAKRYLVSTDSAYFEALSEASKITLKKQGGRMNEVEVEAFEQDPLYELHLALRRLDEKAKTPDRPVSDILWLEAMVVRHFNAM
jgi:2-amino-1-hydroxyethylphosphonate dioxygenase (glycine-forming)